MSNGKQVGFRELLIRAEVALEDVCEVLPPPLTSDDDPAGLREALRIVRRRLTYGDYTREQDVALGRRYRRSS